MTTKKQTKKAEKATKTEEKENKFMQILHKIFGGIEMSWRNVIAFAIIMGAWTAIMAMKVPDGNSFHDIAVTPEWWVLPAIFIIANCKKPLEAALKTFVFFLISQPLVYLIQVPFNSMGWSLFQYYGYWFVATLLTFPGAFIGWFIKHDKWYSGIILSVMTGYLVITGAHYVATFADSFPNHLLSAIYCFAIIPIFIFAIFKDKIPRIIAAVITVITLGVFLLVLNGHSEPFETYNNTFIDQYGITFEGEPYKSFWSGYTSNCAGNVEVIKYDGGYNYKLSGCMGNEYTFGIADSANEKEYRFKYYFDKEQNTVIIEQLDANN